MSQPSKRTAVFAFGDVTVGPSVSTSYQNDVSIAIATKKQDRQLACLSISPSKPISQGVWEPSDWRRSGGKVPDAPLELCWLLPPVVIGNRYRNANMEPIISSKNLARFHPDPARVNCVLHFLLSLRSRWNSTITSSTFVCHSLTSRYIVGYIHGSLPDRGDWFVSRNASSPHGDNPIVKPREEECDGISNNWPMRPQPD